MAAGPATDEDRFPSASDRFNELGQVVEIGLLRRVILLAQREQPILHDAGRQLIEGAHVDEVAGFACGDGVLQLVNLPARFSELGGEGQTALLQVRRRFQIPDKLCSARAHEIAYTARTGPGNDLKILELATGAVRQLTFGEGSNESPTFAPNGRHLAFMSTRAGKAQVFTIARDGKDLRQVTKTGNNYQPDWSK